MTSAATAPVKLPAPETLRGPAPRPIKVLGSDTVAEEETELVILPDPVGFRLLVALPTMAEKTAAGIIIPKVVNERERAATVVGTVLAMGDTCYMDMRRFGVPFWDDARQDYVTRLASPWCAIGDTVLFSRYSGMRFKARDIESGDMVEYRMLADDEIVGTVPAGARVGAV